LDEISKGAEDEMTNWTRQQIELIPVAILASQLVSLWTFIYEHQRGAANR
jgi:hypothetical protein